MDQERVSMGIGPIGLEKVFPRTFRFLLTSKRNPEAQNFTKKVNINYIEKTLDIFVYELSHLQTHNWIMEMIQEDYSDDFTLTALDGCGNKLYILEFQKTKIIGHNVEYDYAKSDVVTHQISLKFQNIVKLYQL